MAVGALIGIAPDAEAVSTAVTIVNWGGTGCIETQGPMIRNPYLLSVPTTQCSPIGSLVWTEMRPAGAWIGVDPIMGNADWISCSVDDGWNVYTDYAQRGDGTDVSCLRVAH